MRDGFWVVHIPFVLWSNYYYYNYYYWYFHYYFTPCVLFTPALTSGLHWSLTASLLRSPGLSSLFWSISTMLLFGRYRFFIRFTTALIPFPIKDRSKFPNNNWYHRHFHVPHFFVFSSPTKLSTSLFFRFLFFFFFSLCGLRKWQNPLDGNFFIFCLFVVVFLILFIFIFSIYIFFYSLFFFFFVSFFVNTMFGLLAGIRWSVHISKSKNFMCPIC